MATRKTPADGGNGAVDSLARLTDLIDQAAIGRLSGRIVDVAPDDPLYPACQGLNRLLDRVELVNREVSGAMQAAVEGRYYRTFIPVGVTGSFVPVAESVTRALESLSKFDHTLKVGRSDIADTAVSLRNEVGMRSSAVLSATEELDATARLLADVSVAANAQAESGLASTNIALSGSEQIASATEELSASIKEISGQADQSKDVSDRAIQQVLRARQVMQEVADSAQAVAQIVNVIAEIARQTNLLALNAAIERARRGAGSAWWRPRSRNSRTRPAARPRTSPSASSPSAARSSAVARRSRTSAPPSSSSRATSTASAPPSTSRMP
jgi:methyl-accepting chemotaxis protein